MSEAKKKSAAARQAEVIDAIEEEELPSAAVNGTEETAPAPENEEKSEEPKEAENEEIARLRELVLQLQKQIADTNPRIIQVMADTEKVTMRFQAEVADDNVAVFGANGMYGQVTGKVGTVVVPKSEWSRFYDETNRRMIDRRWLVVLSGMSDEEREIYNCAYKEGEILDEEAFRKLLGMGRELLAVFPKLCIEHQEMVGRRFIEAWQAGKPEAQDRELIVALNEMSKESYRSAGISDARRKGIFQPIIEGLNAMDIQD